MTDMNWLDDLLASIPEAQLTASASGSAVPTHPREVLSANLAHNSNLVDDPDLLVKGRKGMVKPDPMFEKQGDVAVITPKYAHAKLKLDKAGNNEIKVPVSRLKDALGKIKAAVDSKQLDDQLMAIKAKRVAAQKDDAGGAVPPTP